LGLALGVGVGLGLGLGFGCAAARRRLVSSAGCGEPSRAGGRRERGEGAARPAAIVSIASGVCSSVPWLGSGLGFRFGVGLGFGFGFGFGLGFGGYRVSVPSTSILARGSSRGSWASVPPVFG